MFKKLLSVFKSHLRKAGSHSTSQSITEGNWKCCPSCLWEKKITFFQLLLERTDRTVWKRFGMVGTKAFMNTSDSVPLVPSQLNQNVNRPHFCFFRKNNTHYKSWHVCQLYCFVLFSFFKLNPISLTATHKISGYHHSTIDESLNLHEKND